MFKQALVLTCLFGALAACSDPASSTADATPEPDAIILPPDAVPAATIVSEQTDAEWTALCEEMLTPEVSLGLGGYACSGEDCAASATAVEDCVAAIEVDPDECVPPDADDPIRDCEATVEQLEICYAAFVSQFVPYATATCENVDDLAPLMLPNTIPACDGLLAKCPDAFSGN